MRSGRTSRCGKRFSVDRETLRIDTSRELHTVLREVVEGARALSRGFAAASSPPSKPGQPRDFVSPGLSPAEPRQLAEWSEALRLFEPLWNQRGALRLPTACQPARARVHSAAPTPRRTFQGTPMRHRGERVGRFFLAGKGMAGRSR